MPKDAELLRRVDEVAHYIWDPIGVSGAPGARDEYASYLAGLFAQVKAGDREAILASMKWIATDRMGLSFDQARAERAADCMLQWKQWIDRHFGPG